MFGCGKLYIRVDTLDGMPKRVFVQVGKIGNCESTLLEGVGRLVTIALECGGPEILLRVRNTLRGMRCPGGLPEPPGNLSCADAVAHELSKFIPPEEETGT